MEYRRNPIRFLRWISHKWTGLELGQEPELDESARRQLEQLEASNEATSDGAALPPQQDSPLGLDQENVLLAGELQRCKQELAALLNERSQATSTATTGEVGLMACSAPSH